METKTEKQERLKVALMKELRAPFKGSELKYRVGTAVGNKGAYLVAYADARCYTDRLDKVMGLANWKNSYTEFTKGFICNLSLKLDGEWITKSDGAPVTNVEPFKGGLSDAFKRAAVNWGVGRYIYNMSTPWVNFKAKGDNKHKLKDGTYTYWDNPVVEEVAKTKPATSNKTVSSNKDNLINTEEQLFNLKISKAKMHKKALQECGMGNYNESTDEFTAVANRVQVQEFHKDFHMNQSAHVSVTKYEES